MDPYLVSQLLVQTLNGKCSLNERKLLHVLHRKDTYDILDWDIFGSFDLKVETTLLRKESLNWLKWAPNSGGRGRYHQSHEGSMQDPCLRLRINRSVVTPYLNVHDIMHQLSGFMLLRLLVPVNARPFSKHFTSSQNGSEVELIQISSPKGYWVFSYLM